MKKLILVRHAKSSWKFPHLADIDRPLNGRGKSNAPEMGQRLLKAGVSADLLLSSPAKRAFKTAKLIAQEIKYPTKNIVTDVELYHSGTHTLLNVLRKQDDAHEFILLFGHNPGITDFANYLTGSDIFNIPTAGIFAVNFAVDSWSRIDKGEFCFYDFPKNEKSVEYSV